MKLTEAERKLRIAVKALKEIADVNTATAYYHQVVDKQIEIAKKALEDIGDEPAR